MKKIILFLVAINTLSIFAQEVITFQEEYEAIFPGMDDVLLDSSIFRFRSKVGFVFEDKKYPDSIEIMNPKIVNLYNVPFLFLKGKKQILILRDKRICICISPDLLYGQETPFFIGIKKNPEREYELWGAYVKASSVLHEDTRTYPPDYLGQIWLERPWSEGVSGYGLGECLYFKIGCSDDRIGRPIGIYLINGYISFTNPERYINNGRIKKMTLVSLKTGISKQFYVLDTPNPQFFSTEDLGGSEFKLIIDDVYPGEKYEDTFVSGIISLNVSWGGPVPSEFFEISPLLK